MVPRRGLEPPRLAAHGPEPCASTNSATWAGGVSGVNKASRWGCQRGERKNFHRERIFFRNRENMATMAAGQVSRRLSFPVTQSLALAFFPAIVE